ncbi:OsmC family protein [Candidatus Sumerlaeota bacterium]|nr:OsmC family protein [Candidatus Sumerlaeota bacterium]
MYAYTTFLKKAEKEKGIFILPEKPQLEVSSPPEFQGTPGVWTPEDLFVASIEGCLMTTLFFFLRKKKLSPTRYESKATGRLEKTPKGLMFTSVNVEATLSISGQTGDIGEELESLTEKYCAISNSVSCPVTYKLRIA